MAKTDDIVRLKHMLDAAQKAVEFTEQCQRSDLERDERLALAVVRLLEIMGEAATNVSEQCRQENTSVPWRQIAGTRNRLIHGYFDIDLQIVWEIVSKDLPPLISQLKNILADNN